MDDQFLKGRYTSDCKVRNYDQTKAYNCLLPRYMHGLSLEFEKFLTVVQLFLPVRFHLPTITSHERNYLVHETNYLVPIQSILRTLTVVPQGLGQTSSLSFSVYIYYGRVEFSHNFAKPKLNRFPRSAYYQEKVIQVKIIFTEMKSDIQNSSVCRNLFCFIR